jgi:hypothetical protein
MISSLAYTKIFLKTQEKSCDEANVKLHHRSWWQNVRTKDSGGLRLTEEGYNHLANILELKEYEVPFTEHVELSPQTIIFFDRFIDCPYYLTNQSITVFSEKKAFELYLFSDDIRKFGLVKAINARKKAEESE